MTTVEHANRVDLTASENQAAPNIVDATATEAGEFAPQLGDHFIPLRKIDIVTALRNRGLLPGAHGEANFLHFCKMMSQMMHYDYYDLLESLKNDYFYFNPDVATESRTTKVDLEATYKSLVETFDQVMTAANFERIPLETALESDRNTMLADVKLKLDHTAFREVRLYARGRRNEEMVDSKLLGLIKRRFTAEIYESVVLFVAVQPEEPTADKKAQRRSKKARGNLPAGSVIVKSFRDIVRSDLRILFPNAKVIMGNKDILRLGLPALFGLVPLAIKLLPAVGVILLILGGYLGVQAASEADENLIKEALAALSVFMAVGAFMARQWGNYQRRSLKYQKMVSDTVYFNNINNNAGIFDHLIGSAEEQEIKEAILAYHFLAMDARPMSKAELDQNIEAWLRSEFEIDVDFEVNDAVHKLERLGVAHIDDAGLMTAQPISHALATLDRRWDQYFQFDEPTTPAPNPASAPTPPPTPAAT